MDPKDREPMAQITSRVLNLAKVKSDRYSWGCCEFEKAKNGINLHKDHISVVIAEFSVLFLWNSKALHILPCG